MKKICVQCGKKIERSRSKYCSHECYQAHEHDKYVGYNPFKGKTTATTGAISELRVAVDLLIKGFNVFRSLSPSSPCDLAVLKNGNLVKIEVRTAHKSTSGKIYRSYSKPDDSNSIDVYAWVLPDEIIYEPTLESYLTASD